MTPQWGVLPIYHPKNFSCEGAALKGTYHLIWMPLKNALFSDIIQKDGRGSSLNHYFKTTRNSDIL